MRTNIEIDDKLIAQAIKLTGLPTKRAVVQEGLRLLVRVRKQAQALTALRGLGWEGDLDAMRPHAAEDEFQDLPMVGHIEGREAVFEHFEAVLAALPDIHFDLDRVVGDEETVFASWRLTATFTGAPFYGVRATGRRIDWPGLASIFPVPQSRWMAMDLNVFSSTVLPTPRSPVSTMLRSGRRRATRSSTTSNWPISRSRPVSSGGRWPAPGA